MADSMTENEYKHINYRLDSIDRQLVDFKGVLTEIALFRKDLGNLLAASTLQESRIDELEKHEISTLKTIEALDASAAKMVRKLDEMEKHEIDMDNSIDVLDNATKKMSSKMNEYSDRLHVVEQRPIRDKADKWQKIADYVFKAVIVAIAAVVAAKLGVSI